METQEEQHRQGRLAQGFLEDHMEHLRTRAESNLSSSEELIEQARKGQVEANEILAKESANAYEEFLDSLFVYYRESLRAAEMGARR